MTAQSSAVAVAGAQSPVMFKPSGSIFANIAVMEQNYVMAERLSKSLFIPEAYQKKPDECLIALEYAAIVGVPVLMVMQNLNVVKGKPSWDGKFIIGAIRGCGRFHSVKFVWGQEGTATGTVLPMYGATSTVTVPNLTCFLSAISTETGEEVKGTKVSIAMAVAEGWFSSKASKWPNMPEQMLQYRAGSFFGRTHIQDILLGMHSADEVQDWAAAPAEAGTSAEVVAGVQFADAPETPRRRTRKAAPEVVAAAPAEVVQDAEIVVEDAPAMAVAPEPAEAAPAPEAEADPAAFVADPEVAKALARAVKLGFLIRTAAGDVQTEENTDWMESEAELEERVKGQLRAFFADRKKNAAPAPEPTQAEKNQAERAAKQAEQYPEAAAAKVQGPDGNWYAADSPEGKAAVAGYPAAKAEGPEDWF